MHFNGSFVILILACTTCSGSVIKLTKDSLNNTYFTSISSFPNRVYEDNAWTMCYVDVKSLQDIKYYLGIRQQSNINVY